MMGFKNWIDAVLFVVSDVNKPCQAMIGVEKGESRVWFEDETPVEKQSGIGEIGPTRSNIKGEHLHTSPSKFKNRPHVLVFI